MHTFYLLIQQYLNLIISKAMPSLNSILRLLVILSFSSLSHCSHSPLTPKAALIRYWNRKVPYNHPHPSFFISKLSPLSPLDFAAFSSLSPSQLSAKLSSFCSSSHLLCSTTAPSLTSHSSTTPDFSTYLNTSFINYATKGTDLTTSFTNYSYDENVQTTNNFRGYSREAVAFKDKFSTYGDGDSTNFTSYSISSHGGTGDFSTYQEDDNTPNLKFTTYDTNANGPDRGFSSYTEGSNFGDENFTSYGKHSNGIDTTFTQYSNASNVVTSGFSGYGENGNGATDKFNIYGQHNNDPSLKFTNYDADANGAVRDFLSYAYDANGGDENFAGYSKHGNAHSTFTEYSNFSNIITSGFSGYGENGSGASNNFTSYGTHETIPELNFKAYGENGNGEVDSFTTYRNLSTVGDESFTSYGKKANDQHESFATYGLAYHDGNDNFTGYGEGSFNDVFNFTTYGSQLTHFKAYYNEKKGNEITFKSYLNASAVPHTNVKTQEMKLNKPIGNSINRWVEPGKFFREYNLKKGVVMPMPDIRDKMPARSFLPRSIASKIAFSANEVRNFFQLSADTTMGKAIENTIAECARAPSRGETKQCATSAEDVIDFAVSVLGSNVLVRSTDNTNGSKGNIMIGDVKGINNGKVTQSVSCHQSLFPYLVYYCHSVPKVRVYEADILAIDSKEKINHGVAICHIDTSDWSAGHGAFLALDSMPGKIEVCHWIFEGDMTWAVAD